MKVRLKAIYDAFFFDGTFECARGIIDISPTLLSFRVTDEEQGLGTILVLQRGGDMVEAVTGDYVLQFDERSFGMVKGANFANAYEPVEEDGSPHGSAPDPLPSPRPQKAPASPRRKGTRAK